MLFYLKKKKFIKKSKIFKNFLKIFFYVLSRAY